MNQINKTQSKSRIDTLNHWAATLLVTTVWGSALLFGLYILAFYFIALLKGDTEVWNKVLPGLFDHQKQSATISIGIHFAAGGIILILGCIQLIGPVREKFPALHRWLGRVYVLASILTAVGGLAFIFIKGTIGGLVMDIGFAGYGLLMFWAAIETFRYAKAKQFDNHRAWAIRLFALAIGSWLYRMDYGFWLLFTDGLGHTDSFDGPFDYFMSFFFYLPNLVVAELFIRRQQLLRSSLAKWAAVCGLYVAIAFLILATYFFTIRFWGPAIVDLFV